MFIRQLCSLSKGWYLDVLSAITLDIQLHFISFRLCQQIYEYFTRPSCPWGYVVRLYVLVPHFRTYQIFR